MREIKFRAWDKWNKQYFENLNNIFITGNGEIGIVDKYGHNLIEEYQERFVSEFSTGLKDKNGVEIYKGDIIDTHWGNEENRLVKYDDEMGFYLTPDQDQHYWTVAYRGEYEVIGNIHENADLLSDTDHTSPDEIGNDTHEFLHGGDK